MVISGTFQRAWRIQFRASRTRTSSCWCSTTPILIRLGELGFFPRSHLWSFLADHFCDSTTFNVDDWISHTPRDVVAKNFGLDPSVFDNVPKPNPGIFNGTVSRNATETPAGTLTGDASFVYRTLQHKPEPVPGKGGEFYKIDSTNFPASKTLAATFVTLKPGGLRELHWHPNAEEWLYFHKGYARATVFTGNTNSRTFDFGPGDTAAFPDNSG